MDVSTVKSHIRTNAILPFYVFTSSELRVQDIYIEKIADTLKLSKIVSESVADIYSMLCNKSFLQKDAVYVIRDDSDFMKNEKAWSDWEKNIGKSVVIMRCSSVDKRSKFYKRFKDVVVEFEPLKEDILVKYIQKEIDLSDKYAHGLAKICEMDYSRCLLEIDKIKNFMAHTHETADKVIVKLVNDGIIFTPPKDAIFDFVDAVLKRQKKRAFTLYRECKDVGEATLVELSVLYNNARQVFQVQSCGSSDITKSTGLTGWQIKCAKEHLGYYTISELVNMLRTIRATEKAIKTGMIDEDIATEYMLVHIL